MDQQQNQMHSAPQLCMNGCGFYGSPSYDGLCSKCHKNTTKRDTPNSEQSAAADISYVLQERSELLHSTSKAAMSVLACQSESTEEVAAKHETETAACASTAGLATAASERVASAASAASAAASAASASVASAEAASAAAAAAAVDQPLPVSDSDTPKKRKNRCEVCRKKVGLTGFSCRCDGLFCSIHRYSDKHDCQFDYRQLGQDEIRKNNPVVVGEKVNKI